VSGGIVTATAPHDAFQLSSRLLMVDSSIRSRHARFLEALNRGELALAEHWHEMRDQALEERHALTRGD
jgi:hypothetical protein